jgi:hypothetical protein
MSGWADKVGKVKLQAPHLFAKWYVSALLAAAARHRPTGCGDWHARRTKQPLTFLQTLVMRRALLDGELTMKIRYLRRLMMTLSRRTRRMKVGWKGSRERDE